MLEKSSKEQAKCLLEHLRSRGLDEYGSVILSSEVREVLGIEIPEVGTKRMFDAVALAEMSAIDYVRNILLDEGKYIQRNEGDYRILLPSENARQIENYMSNADKKLKRAQRLSKNTPRTDVRGHDNTAARLHMKRESIRTKVTMGKCEAAA